MNNVTFTEWQPMAVLQMAERASIKNLEKASVLLISKIKESMREAKSGRTYSISGAKHTASAEGETPAVLTHQLIDALDFRIIKSGGEVISRIGVNLDQPDSIGYAVYLELGTSKMGERSYLRRTLFQNEDEIRRILGG